MSSEEPKYCDSHNVKTNVEGMRSVSYTHSGSRGRSWGRNKKQTNWTLHSVYSRNQKSKRNIRTTVNSQPLACNVFVAFENCVGELKSLSGSGSTCVHKLYLFFPLWVLMTF